MIYLLLIVFLIVLYLTFQKFDKDIIAPPVVLVAGYTLSIVCATVNVKNWGIDLHFNTFFVLVYGTLFFVITSYIVKIWMEKKYTCDEVNIQRKLTPISINTKYLYVYIVFQILVMIIWVWNIYIVTDTLGNFNSFFERMVEFKRWSSYSTEWINNYFYFFINQFNQISTISPYLFIYIIIKNNFIQKQRSHNAILSISVLLSIIQIFLNGGRLGVINLFFCGVLYYFVFYQKNIGYKLKINRKLLYKSAILFIIGLLTFFYLKAFVGRGTSNMSIDNIIPYLTMYIGGPIQLLDMFLQNPIEASDILGKETFATLNFQLIRFEILDVEPYIIHLEFRTSSTGVSLGNIYTAYRSYLYDFGFVGLTILPIIFAAITNYFYYKIICSKNSQDINFLLLFYSTIFWTLFFDFVRCFFYTSVCAFAIIKQFIFLIILTAIFVKEFNILDLVKSMVNRDKTW